MSKFKLHIRSRRWRDLDIPNIVFSQTLLLGNESLSFLIWSRWLLNCSNKAGVAKVNYSLISVNSNSNLPYSWSLLWEFYVDSRIIFFHFSASSFSSSSRSFAAASSLSYCYLLLYGLIENLGWSVRSFLTDLLENYVIGGS